MSRSFAITPQQESKTIPLLHLRFRIFVENLGVKNYHHREMESKRQQKVARQIQKDLSDIFQKEGRTWFDNAFITVTVVRMSPDLGVARVYLSFLIAKNKGILLEQIQERSKSIRQLLGQKIRHQLRIVPELHFYLDDTAEYAAKMDTLFAGLTIPPTKEEN